MMKYTIERAEAKPALPEGWDSEFWKRAGVIEIGKFHARSEWTGPRTEVKVLFDEGGLYLFFRVRDRGVRATFVEYQSPVCQDSCVEFFVQPVPGKGYFNFEVNPLGTMLLFYVTDPTRVGSSLKEFEKVPADSAAGVKMYSSMSRPTNGNSQEEMEWWVQYFVPFAVFERFVGPVRPVHGAVWRANFYKCGDKTPRPHWAAWADVGDALNFHQPERFGEIAFAG